MHDGGRDSRRLSELKSAPRLDGHDLRHGQPVDHHAHLPVCIEEIRGGIYWLAVVLISIVGTLITDNLIDNFGVSLETTAIVFGVVLAAIFAAWYASEKTLSVHTICTMRREAFYWLAILFTFALGTAAGDLAAEKLNLGYMVSAIIFGALIAVVAVAHKGFKLNAVLAFWIAYILTRPLGASLGDYLSQSHNDGGLGWVPS